MYHQQIKAARYEIIWLSTFIGIVIIWLRLIWLHRHRWNEYENTVVRDMTRFSQPTMTVYCQFLYRLYFLNGWWIACSMNFIQNIVDEDTQSAIGYTKPNIFFETLLIARHDSSIVSHWSCGFLLNWTTYHGLCSYISPEI